MAWRTTTAASAVTFLPSTDAFITPSTSGDGEAELYLLSSSVVGSGVRIWENKEKWYCSDIETQKLVLRLIDAFLECISSETLQYPLVKEHTASAISLISAFTNIKPFVDMDSAVDMVRALKSILEFKSQSILRFASNVTVKMVNVLSSSRLQTHVLDLICPIANLLSSQQLQVAMSCATAMNVILSKLSSRHESEVWQILKETKAVGYTVHNIKQFFIDDKPIEYFQEMASVLSKILLRWSSFRFCVWNDSKFPNFLDAVKVMSENSVKLAVLQLYSSLALCGNGVEKLLENGEELLQVMINCMDSPNTFSVRAEAFKLAQCLALSRRQCMRMMNVCGEPLVKAVTSAMNNWSSLSDKSDKSQLSVMEEACRLATITRWAGDHQIYFWKAGIDRLLLDLLLENHPKVRQLQPDLSVNDLIIIVRESYYANPLLSFRPYVWDILGGLAANCAENINHEIHGNELRLNVLIICACFSFIDSVGTLRQVSQKGITNMSECESAIRAVLMMVYSPCKFIASSSRSILCEILNSDFKGYVEYLLEIVKVGFTGNKGSLQILVSLMSLACYCSQPMYHKLIIKSQGIKIMVVFIMRWLNNPVRTRRENVVPHLRDSFSERRCCFAGTDDWEGEDMLLLFSLWVLAELLHHSTVSMKVHPFNIPEDLSEAQLVQKLQEICRDDYSHGSRWYAAYLLGYFGLFGFPSKLGKRIGKSLGQTEHSDVKLDIINEESVFVHEVILTVRCPSLLPPGESVPKEKSSSIKAVRLSAHVDQQSLLKLLEYVYSGYLQAGVDLVKKLRIFARHCKLESLMQMLCRRNPKWGVPIPNFDLRPALGPDGHCFSDLIVEAGSTTQLAHWKCSGCSAFVPHLHVHKVILESSCDYLRALFQSGMQESHLQTIKVPVSWESLDKLVSWFYSDQLPVPTFDCLWDNLDIEEKFKEVQSYLELCWLAEFWLIEDLHEECYKIVVSCLDSSKYLSTKLIQIAANFSQWELAQVAANYMAPSYHHLRNSGELDALDSNLVEMGFWNNSSFVYIIVTDRAANEPSRVEHSRFRANIDCFLSVLELDKFERLLARLRQRNEYARARLEIDSKMLGLPKARARLEFFARERISDVLELDSFVSLSCSSSSLIELESSFDSSCSRALVSRSTRLQP
ncbi:BTB/POZ domain-containing protein at1g04390 [Phtheirospermum japonicum]|uniref:BTB/POZ domain-containing protein at1g04390 n=1 Tax=Phtheirospermum japonicum TaxID=374723 RepID=A0A830CW58_9LAMI|nr:BTB/POZ domain-containing protein at1g04390 [Phtheirospermum japonicum]